MTVEQEIQLQASYAYDDGKAAGFSQGLSQGAHEKAVETARKMLKREIKIADIIDLTGLTAEEINSLIEKQ